MFGRYNHTSPCSRPRSAQYPRPYRVYTYNNDSRRPKSSIWVGVGKAHTRNICRTCIELRFEKSELVYENNRLKNGVQTMLKNKEEEVWNEMSTTLDNLDREISMLKNEERRRVSENSSIPYDQVARIRQRLMEENAELEKNLWHKENEVWDIERNLNEAESKIKRLENDLKKRDYDAMLMKRTISDLEERNRDRYANGMKKIREESNARFHELTYENICLKRELEKEKTKSLLARWKHDNQHSFQAAHERDDIEKKKQIENLREEKRRLSREISNIGEKYRDALRQKEGELSATKQKLRSTETELRSIRSSFDETEQKLKRSSAFVLLLEKENQQLKDKTSNFKRGEVLQGQNSNTETEVIKRFKEEASNKEKEIRRLQERIETEERKSVKLQNNLLKESKQKDDLLQRKGSQLQELLRENRRLQNEVTRLNSEKSGQHTQESVLNTIKLVEIERELNTKRKEIESLHERIKQLQNENILLQKESDSTSKDRHNLHARNSNAADEMKILQTEVEEKHTEIQILQNKCILDEKENKELQKKYSKVSEERDNLYQRNQGLQGELDELNAKIRHLEENKMKTTDEWKYIEKVENTVVQLRNDNDRLKQEIASLSKENDTELLRFFTAEKELAQLKLDIKSKGEEIRFLQKQITQKEAVNEKIQESLFNMAKENQQLSERLEKGNSNDNNKLQLAKDESKRLQEKIRELLNENSHLQKDIDDLSKQKEDALTRMRSLERVKSNCDDQLLLAKDESKRLQGKIRDLHGENNQLRRDIDDLAKQKEDALTRLSKVAGAKLTHGNAAITDLSDTDRPTKLAEKFSELYDNAWTDAFEELDNTFQNEEETIKVLLQIFQEAYKFCVQTENNYETRIGQAVFTLANETESRQITSTNVEIQKVLADLRISLSTACCSVVEEMLISKLPSIMKSVDVAACPLTKQFARQCASLSWKMRIRDPPLFVRFEFRCGSTFNSDVLKKYTKTGGYLDFLVWPALYLHENGPVLAKGVAQPKIAP